MLRTSQSSVNFAFWFGTALGQVTSTGILHFRFSSSSVIVIITITGASPDSHIRYSYSYYRYSYSYSYRYSYYCQYGHHEKIVAYHNVSEYVYVLFCQELAEFRQARVHRIRGINVFHSAIR